MTAWSSLARLLGVRSDQVEDTLASPACARQSLDRRGFLKALVAAPVVGTAFSIPAPAKTMPTSLGFYGGKLGGHFHVFTESQRLDAIADLCAVRRLPSESDIALRIRTLTKIQFPNSASIADRVRQRLTGLPVLSS